MFYNFERMFFIATFLNNDMYYELNNRKTHLPANILVFEPLFRFEHKFVL